MQRLLVTGAAGFIGSHFVEHWLKAQASNRVVAVDALTYAGNLANLEAVRNSSRLRFVHADICDGALMEQLLRQERIDCIVNFAAETHVDRSIVESGTFLRSNLIGTHSLLEAARRVWNEAGPESAGNRFHQISTDEVFGPAPMESGLRKESEPYAPGSPYAASKAAADHLVHAYRNTYGLNTSLSYSSNVYGPRQHPEKLIPKAITSLLGGVPVPVYGDGQQSRSWMHVSDLCRALHCFLSCDSEGLNLYLGSTFEITNLELVQMLCAIADRSPGREAVVPKTERFEFVADRPGHDRRYGMDSSAFQTLSGFEPAIPLEEGLVETFNWFRNSSNRPSVPIR